jgi:hypothetical protein
MKQTSKKHSFHLKRAALFCLLFAAFFIIRSDAGSLPGTLTSSTRVLAYATEMSRSGLLSGTNAARSSNGLAPLALNAQLNNSAQAKAQDMANKDYWAHVSPDGTQPWYFFDQAGYSYVRAGENLAYGFLTSQGAVDGWMNSATHRANILGDYADVGFGIVNAPNYQSSGEQTIVVAHYGTKAMAPPPAPAPAPTPAVTTPSTPPRATPSTAPSPTPAPTAPADQKTTETNPALVKPDSSQTPTQQNDVEPTAAPASTHSAPVQVGTASRLSVLGMIAHRSLPVAALISLVMVSIAVIGYALTHRAAFEHAIVSGEHFAARHPGIDAAIVAAITALILLTTYGNIS